MDVITSRQHPLVKEFRELARGAGPLMLLDGWHLLSEAAAAHKLQEENTLQKAGTLAGKIVLKP